MVGSPLNPDSSYSNAEVVVVAAWWVYDDQGSGELDRAGAKGSSNGFSSKAREDCCKRSSKPDMTALLHSGLRQTERACTLFSHGYHFYSPISGCHGGYTNGSKRKTHLSSLASSQFACSVGSVIIRRPIKHRCNTLCEWRGLLLKGHVEEPILADIIPQSVGSTFISHEE